MKLAIGLVVFLGIGTGCQAWPSELPNQRAQMSEDSSGISVGFVDGNGQSLPVKDTGTQITPDTPDTPSTLDTPGTSDITGTPDSLGSPLHLKSWSSWGDWSTCNAANGYETRQRYCIYRSIQQPLTRICDEIDYDFRPCQKGCIKDADIVFSFDRSKHISPSTLSSMFNAIVNVIKDLDKDDGSGGQQGKVRVGVQSMDRRILKHLNEFNKTLGPTPSPGGRTDLLRSLEDIETVMFNASNGDRPEDPDYPNILIFLTDGLSISPETSPSDVPPNVDRVIVVGVGSSIASDLKDYATSPDDFFKATLTCQIEEFLRQKLLCEHKKLTVTPSSSCPKIV